MENFRYEKIGRNSFLKVACEPLVANSLVNVIETSSDEEPLETPAMNFGDEKKSEKVDNKNEQPLDIPTW